MSKDGPDLHVVSLLETESPDIWWVLCGLKAKTYNNTIQELLCNKLYEVDPDDLDFYLPQLW
jgi:hypothetical protein